MPSWFGPAADMSSRAGPMSRPAPGRRPWAHLPPEGVPGGVRQLFPDLALPRRIRPRHRLRPRPLEGGEETARPPWPAHGQRAGPVRTPPFRSPLPDGGLRGARVRASLFGSPRAVRWPASSSSGRRAGDCRPSQQASAFGRARRGTRRGLADPDSAGQQTGKRCKRRASSVRAPCGASAGPVQGVLRPFHPRFNLERGVLS